MPLSRDSLVFMDTNAIIEAERASYLRHLVGYYHNLSTVSACMSELHTGNRNSDNNIFVDADWLSDNLKIESVDSVNIASLKIDLNGQIFLDSGEEEIIAHVRTLNPNAYYVCSPDKACIRAAYNLGFVENIISLEGLLSYSGQTNPNVRSHFKNVWLENFRTRLLFE